MNLSADTKVTDLTVGELRLLIHRAVSEAMLDPDPDAGLELRPEFVAELLQPIDPEHCISIEELAKKVGFAW